MAKRWSATSLVALALLWCLVGIDVEAQESTWQKPALQKMPQIQPSPPKAPQYPQVPNVQPPSPPKPPQYPQRPQAQAQPYLQYDQVPQVRPPSPPKAPQYPQAPQILPPSPPKAPQYPQVPQVQPPSPPKPPQYPQYPQRPQAQAQPYPQYDQVPQVQPPPPPKAPQYPQTPQVQPPPPPKAPQYPQTPQVQPPPPPKAPQFDQVPQVLPPSPPKSPQYRQPPQVLPPSPPKTPQYRQPPQVLPPSPPKTPQYRQPPQVLPPSPPKTPQYRQPPQVLPPSPPKTPQYPQTPQVQPPSPPKFPQYPQTPQVQPPSPPKFPQYPQTPQVQPPSPPKFPQYPQTPQVQPPSPPKFPQYPRVPQVQPPSRPQFQPPSPPKFPQYPQKPQPRGFSNYQSSQGPQDPQKHQPHQPKQPHDPHRMTDYHSCEVEQSQKIPCGGSDISAAACAAISCCFDGRQCFFGKSVTVQCTKDAQFILVVGKDDILPNIDLESISLLGGGPGCTHVDSNSQFAIYQFPVTACGSVVMEEPGVIIYENRMVSSYEVGVGPLGAITRDSHYELLFQCRYVGTSIETVVVEVLPLQDPPLPVAALGPIRVHMRLANGQCYSKGCNELDVAYNSFYTEADYPVTKVLRDPVYVEVQLIERTDPMLVLTLGRCWTTTSPNAHSLPQWDILINGCPYTDDRYLSSLVPVDASSGLEFPSHYRRFLFKMFTFVDARSLTPMKEQVFIHCSTAVCSPIPGRSCEPSCFRKRRDVGAEDQKMDDPKVVVTVGPVIMGASEEEKTV